MEADKEFIWTTEPYKNSKFKSIIMFIILTKPKNWVGLTVVNVRAVKNAVQLQENVGQNYMAIG